MDDPWPVRHLVLRTPRLELRPADDAASLRVSEKLGYRRDGSSTMVRRGERVDDVRLLLEPALFTRPPWTLEVAGLAACLPLLGL